MKTYILGKSNYDGKIIRYSTEQQAKDMGVQYLCIEAESWAQALEKMEEHYTGRKEEE